MSVLFTVLAKVCLYGFVYTSVGKLRSASHIFVHVEVTLKKSTRLKSQYPANVQAFGPGSFPAGQSLISGTAPASERDDERTLSIYSNGAYYLSCVRLCEIGAVLPEVQSGTGWRSCSFAGKTSVR
jgi:hypothetical protein